MDIIRKRAYARAGLLGNPSDGYNGKTISISVRNFRAEVVLYEWDSVDIVQSEDDRAGFRSIHDLVQDVRLHGYYGGIRLIRATIKRFVDFCRERNLKLHDRNFSVRYETNIPRQVGMAGSSSIIVATLRCLMKFYGVEIRLAQQPAVVLSVETEELGISAGLQDRVIQCYEGMVYMDFDRLVERVADGVTFYAYERLDPALLPPIYLAYHDELSEPTETFHNDIRGRYDCGESLVVNAMQHFGRLTVQGREALLSRDWERLSALIDENFDTRRSIYKLPSRQINMVETARRCGASAKFAGSELPQVLRRALATAKLRHVHVNDPNGRGPGFGDLQFAPLLKILHEADYPGYISVEVFDFAPDPRTIAARSLGYLHGILESIGAKANPAKMGHG